MTLFDPHHAEIMFEDEGNFVALYRTAMLQIRTGKPTVHSVEAVAAAIRLGRARSARSMLSLLEPTAQPADGEVRARQVNLFRSLIRHEGSFSALVISTESLLTGITRTIWQTLAIGIPRLRIFAAVPEAAAWLSTKSAGLSAQEWSAMTRWGQETMRARWLR